MSSKTIFILCAQALLIQSVFTQTIGSRATVTGNSVVDNNIYIGNGGLSSGAGLGLGLANAGINAGFGSSGLIGSGFGSSGLIGSGFGNSGVITSGIGSSGLIGANFGSSGLIGSSIGSSGLIGAGGINVGSSGPLLVTAISPIGPSGLAIASENTLSGNLLVSGQLPFLSAVAFDGSLPTAGSGVATCGCGSGSVGIVSEGISGPNFGIGSGIGGLYF